MIAIIIIVLLVALTWRTKKRIETVNEEIKQEMGEAYNPDVAGKPWRDGCIIVLLTVVATAVVLPLLGALVPLPP